MAPRPKDTTYGLTAEKLRALISYDPLTGVFKWIVKPAHGPVKAGDIAGVARAAGRRFIKVDGKVAGLIVGDGAGVNQIDQGFIHRLHTEFGAGLDDGLQLVALAFADDVAHGRCGYQDLGCGNTAAATRTAGSPRTAAALPSR